jgi:hypothetical protein
MIRRFAELPPDGLCRIEPHGQEPCFIVDAATGATLVSGFNTRAEALKFAVEHHLTVLQVA